MKKQTALLPGIQAMYYLFTGFWSLIDIHSFMAVTGPKTDIWLVKMVGLLSVSIGLALFCEAVKGVHSSIRILGIAAACSFLVIDIYYTNAGLISRIYLLDAAAEAVFILWWVILPRRL